MVTASAKYPLELPLTSHCHGTLDQRKIEFLSSNISRELEISRINLCPSSSYITSSKVNIKLLPLTKKLYFELL